MENTHRNIIPNIYRAAKDLYSLSYNAAYSFVGFYINRFFYFIIAFEIIGQPTHVARNHTRVNVPAQPYPTGFLVHGNTALIMQVYGVTAHIEQGNIIGKIAGERINQVVAV